MNRIIRPFKEGFIGIIRHLAMSISSIMAVMVTLFLVALFLILTVNLQQITDSVQSKVQIHVQILNDVDLTGIGELKRQILEIDGVVDVEFSDKDDELNHFIESYGEEGKIFEMYRGEKNPLRNAFIIEVSQGNLIEQVSNKVESLNGIESVNYGGLNDWRNKWIYPFSILGRRTINRIDWLNYSYSYHNFWIQLYISFVKWSTFNQYIRIKTCVSASISTVLLTIIVRCFSRLIR